MVGNTDGLLVRADESALRQLKVLPARASSRGWRQVGTVDGTSVATGGTGWTVGSLDDRSPHTARIVQVAAIHHTSSNGNVVVRLMVTFTHPTTWPGPTMYAPKMTASSSAT